MAKREITIVIGTLNRPAVAAKLLKQLSADPRSKNWEILAFDQSDHKNYQLLKHQFKPIATNFNLFHLDKPNTCRYLNLGWQKAAASIVLYLDDDVELTETTIDAHLNAYQNPKILGVAGRVINDGETGHNSATGRIKQFGAVIDKNFSSTKKTFVDFPYGCNMSFRKNILQETGGFDEKLAPPVYAYNEVDLGYRINKKYPHSIVFEPEALVYHHRYPSGGTRHYSPAEIAKNSHFNYGYFIAKNFCWWQNILFWLRRLPYQLIREPGQTINILKGFINGKFSIFNS